LDELFGAEKQKMETALRDYFVVWQTIAFPDSQLRHCQFIMRLGFPNLFNVYREDVKKLHHELSWSVTEKIIHEKTIHCINVIDVAHNAVFNYVKIFPRIRKAIKECRQIKTSDFL
jgi:hypothetical protein